jgi:ribosomal protein S18 acetylase RimI-like enzyme
MIQTIERNLQEVLASFNILPGSVAIDTDKLVGIHCPIPLSFVNGVALARFGEQHLREEVAAAIRPYQEKNLPFRWWVTPSSSPAALAEALVAHGMTKRHEIPGMAIETNTISANIENLDDFEIQCVHDQSALAVWSETFAVGFDNPSESVQHWIDVFSRFGFGPERPWRLYTGFLKGGPIATSSAFLGSAAVGIYHVVTLEGARRLGIGSAMTLAPLVEARLQGYKLGVLQSSEMGLSIYERMGFKQHFVADFFVWGPDY